MAWMRECRATGRRNLAAATDDTRETRRYFELVTEVREALRRGGGLDDAAELEAAASEERTIAEGAVG